MDIESAKQLSKLLDKFRTCVNMTQRDRILVWATKKHVDSVIDQLESQTNNS